VTVAAESILFKAYSLLADKEPQNTVTPVFQTGIEQVGIADVTILSNGTSSFD
jgi:hypothetical protein